MLGRLAYRLCIFACAAAVAHCLISARLVVAQEAGPVINGQPMSPEQAKAMMEARHGRPMPMPGGPQPQPEEKKDDADKKKEGDDKDKDKDKKKEEDASVKRPEKPPRVPDPREFEVKLDDKGRVPPFSFVGQPWPDVLQWFATLSKSSLDWQELPADYLNLATDHPQAVDEIRDLINRHLHARGYTMLSGGEVLSVFKIEKLDPSLVPRLTEDQLYDAKPYDFVKVSFELPASMAPDKAAPDIKQVLSPSAKVFPLVTSKRVLVMDAVANLRLVSALLNEERAVQDGRIVPREFILKYARAEQVIDTLYVIVGLDPKSRPTQMELQLQQQKLQIMMQMQQQGKDVASMLKQEGPPVFLAYNRQRNSVLANAPPDYMRIIEQAVKSLDVPSGSSSETASAQATTTNDGSDSATGHDARGRVFKKYQLVTLDPERLVVTLQDIGGLDPWTELRGDSKSKTLFVQATGADHAKIASLIDQLDGSGRQFEVMYLRRLPADAVAVTIHNLMVGQEEEKADDNPFSFFNRRNQQPKEDDKPNKGFRVEADTENNRLLLWASDAELAEVRRLLAKLGELPGGAGDPRPVRFVEPPDAAATERLLDQLRSAWPSTGKNELIIKRSVAKPAPPAAQPRTKGSDSSDPDADRATSTKDLSKILAQYAQLDIPPVERVAGEKDSAAPADDPPTEPTGPPVTVTVTPDGRLMLSSEDTAALDRLEDLITHLSPPARRFKVFHLEYTTALNMYWNLTDFYKEELENKDSGSGSPFIFLFDPVPKKDDKAGLGLSKRRKLQIIYDTPSNTILVANASQSQLHEIEQLIAEYDRPAPADSVKTRRTAAIKIRYSKASTIATALKDVYRDLLSSRDREFDKGDKRQQSAQQERVTVIEYGQPKSDGSSKRPSPVKIGFEGALSVGVDEVSNMLIVSVQEELFDSVMRMVEQLDEEARPKTTVEVHKVASHVSPKALQKALTEALGNPWPGGKPEKANAEAPADQKPKVEAGAKPPGDANAGGNKSN
jgi:type II secretory pathway component GspD/PulD (secretin)